MAGDTITLDGQFELNGVLLGELSSYEIITVTGLDDLPDVRAVDREKALRHGLYAIADYYGKRTVVFDLEVWGDTSDDMRSAIEALAAATNEPDVEVDLVARLPGSTIGDLLLRGRTRKRELPFNVAQLLGVAQCALQFEATDPRIYGNSLQSDSTGVVTATGGLSLPISLPIDFGGTGTSGTLALENLGNFEAPWTATIAGPVTNPQITNTGTSQVVKVEVTVASGSELVIDQDARRVLLDGVSKYSALSSDSDLTWGLKPGTTNVRFSGTTAGSPTATFEWRHTNI